MSQPPKLADALFVLAIDIGTSSVRALVCTGDGSALPETETQIPYSLRTTQDGGAEFDAARLVDIMVQAVDETLGKHRIDSVAYAAVGVTSFWHSLLGLNAAGDPVTPIYYWADARSDATIGRLAGEADWAAIRQRTGCRLHSSYWPAKLFWLRQTDPDRFAAAETWVSFTEYAARRVTGDVSPGMSVSMASGTGLLDVHNLCWDDQVLHLLDLTSHRLPALIDLDHQAQLSPEFAARWPSLAGAAWLPALGDGACANVGSSAVGPGRIALTLGTSGAMRLILPAPAGASWPVPDGLWAYRLDRDHAVLGGALSNGGNVRRWLLELTGLAADADLAGLIGDLEADGHGLTMLPFVAGERSPGWHVNATGAILGLTLATTPVDLARATMEAVALRFARIYEELLPIAAAEHRIIGNGGAIVGSPEWTKIIASALGHEILALPAGDEATARGAALMALRAVGALGSLADAPDSAAEATPIEPVPADYERYVAAARRQQSYEQLLYPG